MCLQGSCQRFFVRLRVFGLRGFGTCAVLDSLGKNKDCGLWKRNHTSHCSGWLALFDLPALGLQDWPEELRRRRSFRLWKGGGRRCRPRQKWFAVVTRHACWSTASMSWAFRSKGTSKLLLDGPVRFREEALQRPRGTCNWSQYGGAGTTALNGTEIVASLDAQEGESRRQCSPSQPGQTPSKAVFGLSRGHNATVAVLGHSGAQDCRPSMQAQRGIWDAHSEIVTSAGRVATGETKEKLELRDRHDSHFGTHVCESGLEREIFCTVLGQTRWHDHCLAGCGGRNCGEVGGPRYTLMDRLVSTIVGRLRALF